MEGLVLTVVLVGAMVATLLLLARGWPRSSRLGGYRARPGNDPNAAAAPPVREDDDVRWDWPGDEDRHA